MMFLLAFAALRPAPLLSRTTVPLLSASPFDGPGWPPLQKMLDTMPVFSVANKEGKPLQYDVDGQAVAIFYADVEAAKEELTSAQKQFADLDCDLIPVGLGSVYQLMCDGKATIVPGAAELKRAGLPEGMPGVGQPLPLFACMEMSREGADGKPVLPLFMSYDECSEAVKQACENDEEEETLEVVGLSLPSVVERLTSISEDTPAFTFIPPTSSLAFIQQYLDESGP